MTNFYQPESGASYFTYMASNRTYTGPSEPSNQRNEIIKELNKLARKIYGCSYRKLDDEEQYEIYCILINN